MRGWRRRGERGEIGVGAERRAWSIGIAATLLALAAPASASTTYSFGTIEPVDVLVSFEIQPVPAGTTYTASSGVLAIDAWVTQIEFTKRPPIVIAPGDVSFSTEISLLDLQIEGPAWDVDAITGTLGSFPLETYSILDVAGGGAVVHGGQLEAGSFSMQSEAGTVSVGLSMMAGSTSGGIGFPVSTGQLLLDVVVGPGTLCSTVVACPVEPLTSPPPQLVDFTGSSSGLLYSTPEPGTALLVGLGLVGLARRARRA